VIHTWSLLRQDFLGLGGTWPQPGWGPPSPNAAAVDNSVYYHARDLYLLFPRSSLPLACSLFFSISRIDARVAFRSAWKRCRLLHTRPFSQLGVHSNALQPDRASQPYGPSVLVVGCWSKHHARESPGSCPACSWSAKHDLRQCAPLHTLPRAPGSPRPGRVAMRRPWLRNVGGIFCDVA